MFKNLVILALLLGVSAAQANKNVRGQVKTDAKAAGGKTTEAKTSGIAAKLGLDAKSSQNLEKVESMLAEAASTGKLAIDSKVAGSYMEAVASIKDANTREWANRLVDYIAAFGEAGDTASIKFIAKLMDLGNRPDVGAENVKYQETLKDIVGKIADLQKKGEKGNLLKKGIEEAVTEQRRKAIEECV